MAKYKVVKVFKDKNTKETYEVNQIIDITVKRANEIERTLKPLGDFLERVEEKKVAEE